MTDLLTDAIGRALTREFGEGYRVYDEEIRQGLERPCFFISCENPSERLFLGSRYLRENRFRIMFFPEEESRAKKSCRNTAERLFGCLRLLDAQGELFMGRRMNSNIENGILSFFVSYDTFLYRSSDKAPVMGGMSGRVSARSRTQIGG